MSAATALSVTGDARRPVRRVDQLGWLLNDTLTIAWRFLASMFRMPESIAFSVIQPMFLVLMFRYVFGGAFKHVIHGSYVDYLMPGIFVQTVAFGSIISAVGMAEDLQKGIIERFRALPMARSAVVTGRTVSDLVRSTFSIGLMAGLGFAVGFRIQTSVPAFLAGLGILLLFAWALSWGFALLGLILRSPETAQLATFPILLPFTFASSAFVPVATMPGWLQAFATNQPVSQVITACRALMDGGPTASHVLAALAWSVGLMVVLAPLAVRRYMHTA
jgi:ABC-2 type transport system permease protein/oleandomycin transport system permease protein